MSGWIGVDFDGTLATYNGWSGETEFGKPIWPMVNRVKQWLSQGKEVKIFTARMSDLDHVTLSYVPHRNREQIASAIQDWLESVDLPRLEVTNVKDYGMIELWDDRAVQVKMNTGEPVGYSTRGL